MLRQVLPKPVSLVDEHNRYLGHNVCELVAGAPHQQSIAFGKSSQHVISGVYDGGAIVRVSSNGVYGDCAYHTRPLLCLHGPTRERLVRDQHALTAAINSREVCRHVTEPTIVHSGNIMGTTLGLDGRGILPPFLPGCRGEDTLFATTLNRVCPEAFVAHLPFAVAHLPTVPRCYGNYEPPVIRMVDIVETCIVNTPLAVWCTSPERRLDAIGHHLVAIAQPNRTDYLLSLIQLCIASALAQRLTSICFYLSQYDNTPALWKAALIKQRDIFESQLESQAFYWPADIVCTAGRTVMQEVSRLLVSYGVLLQGWAELQTVSRRFSDEMVVRAPQ